jgi:hypothetical protein
MFEGDDDGAIFSAILSPDKAKEGPFRDSFFDSFSEKTKTGADGTEAERLKGVFSVRSPAEMPVPSVAPVLSPANHLG